MRIVIDTNVFIIALFGKSSPKLQNWLSSGKYTLLFSDELYMELVSVIKRPKFKKVFTQDRIIELLSIIETVKENIKITSHTDICRDIKDNFLLDLCLDGKAEFLITEDFDLLDIKEYHNTKIVNYKEFIKYLN